MICIVLSQVRCGAGAGRAARAGRSAGARHGVRARGSAMAVSCPEVMYGAYYPYLYGRGAGRSFHHAPHFQYDRVSTTNNGNTTPGQVTTGQEHYVHASNTTPGLGRVVLQTTVTLQAGQYGKRNCFCIVI